MSDVRASSLRRTLAGLIALVAILCLPALHALHLRFADDAPAAAAVESHGGEKHGHDAGHCAICLSFQSTGHAAAEPDLTILCAFDAPATFPPALYVAPPTRAFVPRVAIPRGPPATRA